MCESEEKKRIKLEVIEEPLPKKIKTEVKIEEPLSSCKYPVWHSSFPYCSFVLLPVKIEWEEKDYS